jgi:acyl-CoA hydrolase/RimJ/RimL family protein N-acetyltransferase
VAGEAITSGKVDLIPSRFSLIPSLIHTGQIPIDAAFVQITPPDESGYASLGMAVDVARQAMSRASLVVGEINPKVPVTFGDTFVSVDELDYMVESTEPPLYFPRWPVGEVYDKVAANVASMIEDGSCLAFSIGPLFEALAEHLKRKKNLGLHTPVFTDALMDLVKSGAVTNRAKGIFRGKCLVSYAMGTKELLSWLNKNPLVEFQGMDKVFHPMGIGQNRKFVAVFPARKVGLTGRVALHVGKGNVTAGPGEGMDFINGAELSPGGFNMFALPSRNLKKEPNIKVSISEYPNIFTMREAVHMVATEFGVATLDGRTVRERAQALIDIAHPEDRRDLVEEAKARNMLFPDQIFLAESAHLYPSEISLDHLFKNQVNVHFRAIRPSDEEEMRRLFYRFSDEAVYYRYFSPIRSMPHAKMQEYVNVDYRTTMSIVGIVNERGQKKLIAEGRYTRYPNRPFADVAFIVDEKYQGLGIASFTLSLLAQLARERGVQTFTADVLNTNRSMMKVFEKSGLKFKAHLEGGEYHLEIPLGESEPSQGAASEGPPRGSAGNDNTLGLGRAILARLGNRDKVKK